jgi:NADP-dependent 3-hydroxy acid dehydrogenase YdfG
MAKPINEQVVVVTGASSGIGRACVSAFAKKGARLGLIARNQEALNNAGAEVRRYGGEAIICPLDVTDPEAVERAAGAVEERFGRIDTWVNNAMVTVFSPVMQMTPEEYRRVTEVTYLGYVYGTQAALRRMIPRDEGTIIQIGSALAYRSIPLQSAYCAAKFAIRGFTDSLRTELIHDGSNVQLTMLQLPAVNTPQFVVQRNKLKYQAQPVPPIYTPEMIADAVVYAAQHPRREMLIGGSTVKAVIGQKLIPGLLDYYLAKTGYSAQQTDQPNDPNRPGNLFHPLPGDPGAHGPFTDRSIGRSIQLWTSMHRRAVGAAASVAAIAVLALARR